VTIGRLAVIAADPSTAEAAMAELRERRAADVRAEAVGGDRVLIYGQFEDEPAARLVVVALRRIGWSAAQRPSHEEPSIAAWTSQTRPVSVADGRLVVCVPWAEFQRDGKPLIEVDPGGAFGAGRHPTTCLLLEALAARLQGGEKVLDLGCGTGVLALAAARLGAASVMGIDVDPAAVSATRANALRNGLGHRVTGSNTPLHEVDGSFDVIVANIGQEILVDLAAPMQERLAPAGWIGLSGISPAQVSRVAAAFHSLRVVAAPQLDDWSAIVGERIAGQYGSSLRMETTKNE
jgi:ribosomal protein L11 methyltransferase